MREFYVFKINETYAKLTKNNPYNLYMILSGIRKSSMKDIQTAYYLFDSINNLISKNEIKECLEGINEYDAFTFYNETYSFNDYFSKETSKMFYHKSYIKIITNKAHPFFLKKLIKIKNMFIIDFKNKDYFWLENIENAQKV